MKTYPCNRGRSLRLNGPLRNYKLIYPNGSESDAVERNEMKKKKTNLLMDRGNTYNKNPLLSDPFVLKFLSELSSSASVEKY